MRFLLLVRVLKKSRWLMELLWWLASSKNSFYQNLYVKNIFQLKYSSHDIFRWGSWNHSVYLFILHRCLFKFLKLKFRLPGFLKCICAAWSSEKEFEPTTSGSRFLVSTLRTWRRFLLKSLFKFFLAWIWNEISRCTNVWG